MITTECQEFWPSGRAGAAWCMCSLHHDLGWALLVFGTSLMAMASGMQFDDPPLFGGREYETAHQQAMQRGREVGEGKEEERKES